MTKLMFYRISDRYINFIRNIDNTILINTENGRQRPYVGIIFKLVYINIFPPYLLIKAGHTIK
ncbi:type III toxin-antitoxin system ToxN/AbiQ family toxin [Caldifermentibacillus hisashii]|uniref:type III toxin-antitoxin system ToxN/AbiQ family toxin n=1 Tax=Caldifermentibacillus hisashii TaxID=996558 RepID=UPI0034D74956